MSVNTEYWPRLVEAARGLRNVPACGDCREKADPGRPAPPALPNVDACEGCALAVASEVEMVVLEWRFKHDLFKTLAVRLASAFRRYVEPVSDDKVSCVKPFWKAVKELNDVVPDEEVEKCRSSESASASSGAQSR